MWCLRPSESTSRLPRHVGSALAWALTFAVFVPLVVNAVVAQRRAASLSRDLVHTEVVEHELRDLDQSLTAAVRLAARGVPATQWEAAYATHAARFTQGLTRAVREVHSPALCDAIEALGHARAMKARVEADALDHVRGGDLESANRAIGGTEYREQIHQFAHAVQHFESAQSTDVLLSARTANEKMRTALWWTLVLFASTVLVWGVLLRASRCREALLRHEIDARIRAREELERSMEQTTALEHQLHRSQRMQSLGQLACAIAHEFANLGLVLTGAVGGLRSGSSRSSGERSTLDVIDDVAAEARRTARSLMCFSGKLTPERRALDAGSVVRETADLLSRLLPDDIRLDVDVDPRCTVRADPVEIEQIVLNLALNARDAMPTGGTLSIACRAVSVASGRVVLAVRDTGVGIAADVLPHIFEPLFTTDARRGTGLGLSIVRQIVDGLDGHVDVRTRAGEGTVFSVGLPCIPPAADDGGGEGAPASVALRVGLFADPSTAALLAREFEDAGHLPVGPDSGGPVDVICVVGAAGRDLYARSIVDVAEVPTLVVGHADPTGASHVHRVEGDLSLADLVRALERTARAQVVSC